MNSTFFIQYDVPALAAATCAAVSCALLGNFLLLRRLSLMGDAISHAVLPGIVVAFLLVGSRATLPVVAGAAIAGVVVTVAVEFLCRLGRVDPGASMGVAFSVLFALGVVLLEQTAASHIDLDADCVLYGQLEDIAWLGPEGWGDAFSWGHLQNLPREVLTLVSVGIVVVLFITIFFKELRITSFDPDLASTLGFRPGWMHYAMMILVSIAVVASFEAVGSIQVIAMLICPPATARLLTDRLHVQLWLSVACAVLSSVGGYMVAAHVPALVVGPGTPSLDAAGTMTVTSGVLLGLTIVFSPWHGLVARHVRRFMTAVRIEREDLLAMLYRLEEVHSAGDGETPRDMSKVQIIEALRGDRGGPGLAIRVALRGALRRGEIMGASGRFGLTEAGRRRAQGIIRMHRLWEHYLVHELGLRPDHVHRTAMALEHVTSRAMQDELETAGGEVATDPHDRPIPDPVPGDERPS